MLLQEPNSKLGNATASDAAALSGSADADANVVKNNSVMSIIETSGRSSTGRPSSNSSDESHQNETSNQGVRKATLRGFSDKLPHAVGSKVLMLLSIKDCMDCEKDYLRAQIQASMEKGLQVVALMGDTLYWHNLKNPEDVSEEHRAACQQQARQLGEKYLNDNLRYFYEGIGIPMPKDAQKSSSVETIEFFNQKAKEAFDQTQRQVVQPQKGGTKGAPKMVKPSFTLIDWQSWCNNERYLECQPQLMREFSTANVLVEAVNLTVENFFKRHKEEDVQQARISRTRSRDYVADETMAIVWNALDRGFDYLLYPKKGLINFEKAIEYFTAPRAENQNEAQALFFQPRPFGILSLSTHLYKGTQVSRVSNCSSTLYSSSPGNTPPLTSTPPPTSPQLGSENRHGSLEQDKHVSSNSSGDESTPVHPAARVNDTHRVRVRCRAELESYAKETLASEKPFEQKKLLLEWLSSYLVSDSAVVVSDSAVKTVVESVAPPLRRSG